MGHKSSLGGTNEHWLSVGLARTMYIRCVYGIYGRKFTDYTVIYGVYIGFWPTLVVCFAGGDSSAGPGKVGNK